MDPFWHSVTRGYDHMMVLYGGSVKHARALETFFVERFKGIGGCRNQKPGGENPPPGVCFMYMVWINVADGKKRTKFG